MVNLDEFWTKNTLVGLGLGQLLSLLVTSTGFSSSELAKKGCFLSFFFAIFMLMIVLLFCHIDQIYLFRSDIS